MESVKDLFIPASLVPITESLMDIGLETFFYALCLSVENDRAYISYPLWIARRVNLVHREPMRPRQSATTGQQNVKAGPSTQIAHDAIGFKKRDSDQLPIFPLPQKANGNGRNYIDYRVLLLREFFLFVQGRTTTNLVFCLRRS
mmetsp:Transcript_1000/g.2519  ORF Transcript_1000/g.2519 Transcript_1000/m.2519 type:complete len:144 (+) Transcript_1000:72-503(+)